MHTNRFLAAASAIALAASNGASQRPNILFVFSDDHRFDAIGKVNPDVDTPALDALADSGVRFDRAFVTTSICSPSRAAVLSGRYGSRNGVPTLSDPLAFPSATFAHDLAASGYRTAHVGKWHLGTSPTAAGFAHYARINSNGSWFQRSVDTNMQGAPFRVPTSLGGRFYETFMADVVVDYIADHAANHTDRPFVLWWCNQVPHVDGGLRYPDVKTDPNNRTQHLPWGSVGGHRAAYSAASMPIPANWSDDPAGWGPPGAKPGYLATSRFVTKSVTENYGGSGGYTNPAPGIRNATRGQDNVQQHTLEYYASLTALDQEIGRVLARLEDPNGDGDTADSIADETWVVFMGDNGWQTGSHKFTSKVLAYEESCRVPLIVRAPGIAPRIERRLALNIDLTATFYDLAALPLPHHLQGASLRPLLQNPAAANWRNELYYEAVVPERSLGAEPHDAIRTERHKLIRTYSNRANALANTGVVFEELYDLDLDPHEMQNLATNPAHTALLASLRAQLATAKARVATDPDPVVTTRLENSDFEATPFDALWSNPGVATSRTPGLLGSARAAFCGGAGAGRLSRALPSLTDFALTFAVQPVTVSGTRSWNAVLHTAGADGSTSSGACLNLRGAANNTFQVFNGTAWVDIPGGANAFVVGQTTQVSVRARGFASAAARYDLSWTAPGSSTFTNHAYDLALFQRAPTSDGITGLNFARTSANNGTYLADEICIAMNSPAASNCASGFLLGGAPHGTVLVGSELRICRVGLTSPGMPQAAALMLGSSAPGWLDLGVFGCANACTSLDIALGAALPQNHFSGRFGWRYSLPFDPSLRGTTVWIQAMALGSWPTPCFMTAPPYRIVVE